MDLQDTTSSLIERAGRRGADIIDARTRHVTPGLAVGATRPGAFVDPVLDPLTGYPVLNNGIFCADDVVDDEKAVG